jgi:hypothetical protein
MTIASGQGRYGDISRYDDLTIDLDSAPTRVSPLTEIGVTGVKRAAGMIDEEFLPALRGRKAIAVFREMALNDPIIGAMLFSIEKLIRQVEWTVVGDDNSPESSDAVQFVEECMEDMSHTWDDMISEILSMLVYGFSWHEIVYKKRVGPQEKDPKKRSRYTDGRIGWRKIPIRAQETHLRWVFDESGGVKAYVQIPPPYYKTCVIPIERSLLFRTGIHKGNPEGTSILRTAYRPWFFKKRLEEFEAIGVERDLAGMPVAMLPSSYMKATEGTNENKVYKSFKKMVQNVRRDEHEGLVLPLEYDEKGKELFRFELMSSSGGKSFNTNELIQRYEQRMLMVTMADFLLLGHEGTGSYAMHVDKTGIFRSALNSITTAIADVFNRHAIPRLFELNNWQLEELPKLRPTNVDPPNLAELAGFMTSMAGLGMQFFPDPDMEKFLREVAHLPAIPDEVLEAKREMAQQQTAMEFMGSNQKFGMVQGGMTPEQAQMASESPHQDQMENEAVGQARGQARAAVDPEVMGSQQAQMEQQQAMEVQHQADMQALAAQDPNAQATNEMDLKGKELDLQGKEVDNKFKQVDHERDQKGKEADFKRDQQGKEKDFKRDQEGKDADLRRQKFLGKLKEAQARQQANAKTVGPKKKIVPKKKGK